MGFEELTGTGQIFNLLLIKTRASLSLSPTCMDLSHSQHRSENFQLKCAEIYQLKSRVCVYGVRKSYFPCVCDHPHEPQFCEYSVISDCRLTYRSICCLYFIEFSTMRLMLMTIAKMAQGNGYIFLQVFPTCILLVHFVGDGTKKI